MTRNVHLSPLSNTTPESDKGDTRLLDQVRSAIRFRHYSIRTEQTYIEWIKRYIRFHGLRHPKKMGSTEVTAFLTHLAVDGQVSSSTQNQALSALLFLYKAVLQIELLWMTDVVRSKRPKRIPVVLTRREVSSLFSHISGVYGLMARLIYGSGLRRMECHRLRIKDPELSRHELIIREGKGNKDRATIVRYQARAWGKTRNAPASVAQARNCIAMKAGAS